MAVPEEVASDLYSTKPSCHMGVDSVALVIRHIHPGSGRLSTAQADLQDIDTCQG
jgi:hypothetical protein